MKCPQCDKTAMGFFPFLLLGWVRISCANCHASLLLLSTGERFWSVLAGGAVVVAAIWFFVDFPFRMLGEHWTVALFVFIIVTTFLVAIYFAWKDSKFVLRSNS